MIKQIYCGSNHCFVIDNSSYVFAWGCNLNRKLGLADEDLQEIVKIQGLNCSESEVEKIRYPIKVKELENKDINNIATGTSHTFAWNSELKKIYCWGSGEFGKLGNKCTDDIPQPQLFQEFQDYSQILDIACGENHTMAIIIETNQEKQKQENQLYVWGCSNEWLLGVDAVGKNDGIYQPFQMNPDIWNGNVTQIEASSNHSMALNKQGKVFSWGNGEFDKLGYKTDVKIQKYPQKIDALNDHQTVQVSLGTFHSVAITSDGSLFTWGRNGHGQLGHGDTKTQTYPKKVSFFQNEKIISVTCGEQHTLALTANNEVYSWGVNQSGQLGYSDCIKSIQPKKVIFPDDIVVKQINCGSKHSLALTIDGFVYSWGSNQVGQLGYDIQGDNQMISSHSMNNQSSYHQSSFLDQQIQQQFSQNNTQAESINQINGNQFTQSAHAFSSFQPELHLQGNQSSFMSPNQFPQSQKGQIQKVQSLHQSQFQQSQQPGMIQQSQQSSRSYQQSQGSFQQQHQQPGIFQSQQQQPLTIQSQQLSQNQFLPPNANKGAHTDPILSHDSSNSFHSSTPIVQKNGKSPSSESTHN